MPFRVNDERSKVVIAVAWAQTRRTIVPSAGSNCSLIEGDDSGTRSGCEGYVQTRDFGHQGVDLFDSELVL